MSGSRTRRDFLQSTLLTGGAGLATADILRLRAAASEAQGGSKSDTAVIQVWLGGGPSQFETFDPKPSAPSEIRGPYSTVATRFPGIRFCEKVAKIGQVLDRTAIIRTVSHTTNGHFVGAHWCSTGYIGTKNVASHPSAGSIASRFRGANHKGLPPYVLISEEQTRNLNIGEVMGPGHLGLAHSAFTVMQDPFKYKFDAGKVRQATANLKLNGDVSIQRAEDRKALLRRLDLFSRRFDQTGTADGIDAFNRAAFQMVTSGAARRAFDLQLESKATREMYGHHRWGQMGLLARRLVESGVTFVTINTAPDSLCWDWHKNIVNDDRPADGSDGPTRGMDISGPPLDQMITALVTDIYQRGLDKKVLLLVWGEFGRTPRVNKTGGRDHWGALMSILMCGGGLRVGQILGASNAKGEMPTQRPVHPNEVLATVYRHLGIDPTKHTVNREGRPFPILPNATPVRELI